MKFYLLDILILCTLVPSYILSLYYIYYISFTQIQIRVQNSINGNPFRRNFPTARFEKSYDSRSLAPAFLPPPPHFPFRSRRRIPPLPSPGRVSSQKSRDRWSSGTHFPFLFPEPPLLTRHTAPFFYAILCNTTARQSGLEKKRWRRERTIRGNRNLKETRGLICCPAKKCQFPSNYVIYKYQRGSR